MGERRKRFGCLERGDHHSWRLKNTYRWQHIHMYIGIYIQTYTNKQLCLPQLLSSSTSADTMQCWSIDLYRWKKNTNIHMCVCVSIYDCLFIRVCVPFRVHVCACCALHITYHWWDYTQKKKILWKHATCSCCAHQTINNSHNNKNNNSDS